MTYIQANFCNSMVDMDIFFLQICATHLPAHEFLTTAIDIFGVNEWLGMGPLTSTESEQDAMLEGLLTFLATIVSSRTNMGNDDPAQCNIEISALLATGDKTHSQLLELMPERSGNVHTRCFEKFLRVLSIFKRPASGSENLEQGLFIPIDDVWEKFYDPLHVLLRAVHRRDFQNSLDRFGNYVKQKKLMPKSGILWPPFRLPNKIVGKQYSDPACILNSRVLHATLLGIFHRAIQSHNNVSEHLLALAVFLLEIAVTNCDNSSNSVLECPNVGYSQSNSPYRNDRETPELLNCYPGDCLTENLRLTITRISLAPPEPQVSPANYSTPFDSDIEWDVSEGDTLPMLVSGTESEFDSNSLHLVPANNMEVAVPQDLSVVREQSLVRHNQPNISEEVQTSQLALPEPLRATAPFTIGNQLALPASATPEGGLEVIAIRRTTNEMFNHGNNPNIHNMLLPFQRVQPVSVPSGNTQDVVPSNSNNQRRFCVGAGGKKRFIEGNSSPESDTVLIDESIISLLLKLHSQLSGTLDSFSLDEETESNIINTQCSSSTDVDMEAGPSTKDSSHNNKYHSLLSSTDSLPLKILYEQEESRIGDGPYFIGNVLRKIARLDEKCAKSINDIRQRLWPNQRERQAEQKVREQEEREERSKRAKERQQKLMADFANKQKIFMEQAMNIDGVMDCEEEDEDIEYEETRQKEYICNICNITSPSTESNPIGLVVLVESSSVIGHRRKNPNNFYLPLTDEDRDQPGLNIRLSTEFNRRIELLTLKFGETSWYLSQNMSWEGGVYIQSCGHHVHLACQESYLTSLNTSQRPQNLNVERGEFLCPVCRQLANSVLPLSPQLDRPTPMIRVPPPPFKDVVSELMTLIKENERPPVSIFAFEVILIYLLSIFFNF